MKKEAEIDRDIKVQQRMHARERERWKHKRQRERASRRETRRPVRHGQGLAQGSWRPAGPKAERPGSSSWAYHGDVEVGQILGSAACELGWHQPGKR